MTQSTFVGPVSVVVTSIAAPNAIMRELAKQCQRQDMSFYVVGDVPSPADFSLEGCEFYSIDRQLATGFRLAGLLPKRHYARKNLGYLLAMRSRSALMLETDDDNMPLPGFWSVRQRKRKARFLDGMKWANIYAYFTDKTIWPRGLPLDEIQTPLPSYESLPERELDCPIQQGLANEDPDVDAIFRMVWPLPFSFDRDREVALAQGTWAPFNSQNTAWFPDAYPLLYLPSFCSFRMTDIWRSFVAQRIAWENSWSLLFRSADVVQERNQHNLMKDFTDEIPGYINNRKICEHLTVLSLEPGAGKICDNLVRCYEELIRIAVMPPEELPLVKAWVEDVKDLR